MTLYRIKDWSKKYENNRTKELVSMSWIPVPNKHDGEGYTLVMSQENGPALLGSWLVIVQVASKCDPRGTLLRDTKKAHDSHSIARLTRFPEPLINSALVFFSSDDLQWLEIVKNEPVIEIPQEDAAIVPQGGVVDAAGGCTEGKGREGNRREVKESAHAHFDEVNIPTWNEVKKQAELSAVPEASAKSFFDHHENNRLWINQFSKLINWQKKLLTWAVNDRTKGNHGTNKQNGQQRIDRSIGTTNEGRASKYAGLGKVVGS